MMTPDDLNACSVEAAAAIIAGNRLIARLNVEGAINQSRDNVDSWLLYAWTSDSPSAAELAVNRCLEIEPDNELALAGKRWLQGIQELVNGLVEENDSQQATAEQSAGSKLADLEEADDEEVADQEIADEIDDAIQELAKTEVSEDETVGLDTEAEDEIGPTSNLIEDELKGCESAASGVDEVADAEAVEHATDELGQRSTEAEVVAETEPALPAEPFSDSDDAQGEITDTCEEPGCSDESVTVPALQSVFNSEGFSNADFAAIAEAVEEATGCIEPTAITDGEEAEDEVSAAEIVAELTGKTPEPVSAERLELDVDNETQPDVELESSESALDGEHIEQAESALPSGLPDELESTAQSNDDSTLADEIRTSLQQTIDNLAASEDEQENIVAPEQKALSGEGDDDCDADLVEAELVEVMALDEPIDQPQELGEAIESEIAAQIEDISQEVVDFVEPAVETESDAASAAAEPVPATPATEPLVMVVDDSPTIRKLVTMTLSSNGFKVVAAADGVEALKMLAEQTPDLILSDIEMPRLGGYQLCKFIRKHSNTKLIPVLLLSGKDSVFDKMRGKMAGANGSITKPFQSVDLVDQVRQQLLSTTTT